MAVSSNNPAGRLHNLLSDARAAGVSSPDASVLQIWEKVLVVTTTPETMRGLSRVLLLPARIRSEVANAGYPREILRTLPQIEKGLSVVDLTGRWSNYVDHFNDDALGGLTVVASFLQRDRPESEINEQTLFDLRRQAEELLEELKSSGLPVDLLVFVQARVEQVVEAIKNLKVDGAMPLREAAEQTFGTTVLRADLWKQLENTAIGNKTKGLAIQLLILTTMTGAGMKAIGDTADAVVKVANAVEVVTEAWQTQVGSDKLLEDSKDDDEISDVDYKVIEGR